MSRNLSGLGPLRHRSRHCHPCCLHGHHPLRPRRLCFALAERALGPCCLSSESLASLSLPTYIRTYVSLALNARFDSISLHLPTFRLHNPPSLTLRRTSVRTCDPSPTSHSRFTHPPFTSSHFGLKVVSSLQPTCQPASQPLGLLVFSRSFWALQGLCKALWTCQAYLSLFGPFDALPQDCARTVIRSTHIYIYSIFFLGERGQLW